MIWIGCVVCFVIAAGIFVCRNYEKRRFQELDKNQHKLKLFYPLCLYLFKVLERFGGYEQLEKNQKIKKQLQALKLSADKEESFLLYRCRKMSIAVAVILGASCFCILSEVTKDTEYNLLDGKYLFREESGGGVKEVPIHVTIENLAEKSINISLEERCYTKDEKLEKLQEAKTYVQANYLGKNTSSNQVVMPLNLIKDIPNNQITVSWDTGISGLVEENGTLHNETVEHKKMEISLIASFCYQGTKEEEVLEEVEFPITILEKNYVEEEQVIREIEQYVKIENEQHREQKKLELPKKVRNYNIQYKEVVEKSSNLILFVGFIVAVLIYFMADRDLDTKMEKRNTQLMMDYPELMNKFILLLGAGMTVRQAWGKMALGYEEKKQGNDQPRYAYEEWVFTWNEMKNGVSEVSALEGFGRRIGLPSYLKFSTLLAQNLRKGPKGLMELLEYEAMDAFEERKEAAKRLGEEAGTKLLMPMLIMLMIVMVIVMYPAFCTMTG